MRQALKDNLKALGSKHNWDHITNQIGPSALYPSHPLAICCAKDCKHYSSHLANPPSLLLVDAVDVR
eukprot:g54174.t1